MLYTYVCNKCEHKYERSNTTAHRKKGGRCPVCTSSDTRQVVFTGRMCERRKDGWYCVPSEEYQLTKFKNAVKVDEEK